MAEWNANQRCSICLIVEIGMRGICFTAPLPAASHKRGRQYLAKVATGDAVTKILYLWRNPHLCPDRGNYALCLGKIGQFPRLAQAVAHRSEDHTSELQSLLHISSSVFCLKQKNN